MTMEKLAIYIDIFSFYLAWAVIISVIVFMIVYPIYSWIKYRKIF